MAKFEDYDVDVSAINEGRWVPVYITGKDGEASEIFIQTRGLTDAYSDAQAKMQQEAARPFNGRTDKLPVKIRRKINIACLIKHVLLDPPVRGLFHDDAGTKPVTAEEFFAKLRDPKGRKVADACFQASQMVEENLVDDVEEAGKN